MFIPPQAARVAALDAIGAGVRMLVILTEHIPLHDDRMPTLEGVYKVPHFDAKAEADASEEHFDGKTTE